MTPITIQVPHNLGKAVARARIENGFADLTRKLAGSSPMTFAGSWNDEVLHFSAHSFGQSLKGRLQVLEDAVRIEIELPAFLGAIADLVKARLRKGTALLLEDKTKS